MAGWSAGCGTRRQGVPTGPAGRVAVLVRLEVADTRAIRSRPTCCDFRVRHIPSRVELDVEASTRRRQLPSNQVAHARTDRPQPNGWRRCSYWGPVRHHHMIGKGGRSAAPSHWLAENRSRPPYIGSMNTNTPSFRRGCTRCGACMRRPGTGCLRGMPPPSSIRSALAGPDEPYAGRDDLEPVSAKPGGAFRRPGAVSAERARSAGARLRASRRRPPVRSSSPACCGDRAHTLSARGRPSSANASQAWTPSSAGVGGGDRHPSPHAVRRAGAATARRRSRRDCGRGDAPARAAPGRGAKVKAAAKRSRADMNTAGSTP